MIADILRQWISEPYETLMADSLEALIQLRNLRGIGIIPMTFIRAPYIADVASDSEVLACVSGKIVAARQKKQLVTAFHPELTDDLRVHEYFISMVQGKI